MSPAFYAVALLADFIAPYDKNERDLDFAYCPPQPPGFDLERGFWAPLQVQKEDPVTLRHYYEEDPNIVVPLGFFVESETYRMLGIATVSTRLFGVEAERFREWHPNYEGDVPKFTFLGSDRYGRDIFSRIVAGSQVSLSIGLAAIVITFGLGVVIGGISGYFGGRLDVLIQRIIEIVNSFPEIPMWLALGAILPADWSSLKIYLAITLVLSLLNSTGLARVVRGKILALREEDYTTAARLIGAGAPRIICLHLLPGLTSHIIVVLTLSIPGMILGETALSFLGLGLRPPIVSWGVMLQDCQNLQILANYPWLLTPVAAIVVTVLSFNFLGDGLRDAADPYSS